ncbi:class A beta-lactamase [Lichenicoccus sp.]|uniref:class A beta-lactamase n=1 Tax=Lichenicoccus sp. TaxID=2781899 RepID=UPI003D0A2A37
MRRRDVLYGPVLFLALPALAREVPLPPVAEYERKSGGHIGFYAENLRTGRQLGWRADERFVMCSTFKASLAACVLLHVDRGCDGLERAIHYGKANMRDWHAPVAQANLAKGWLSVGEMCKAAVEQSDNTCATLLLSRIGGPAALTAFWRRIGDGVTRLDDTELALNFRSLDDTRDTTTPAAMARTLRRLVFEDVLSNRSRRALTGWLIGCQTGGNRLRAGLPANWLIGDKTGNNGRDAAGDIAVAWPRADVPIVVAVYTRGGSPTPGQLKTAFAGIGRFVGIHLSGTA